MSSETQSRLHPHLTATEMFILRAILAGHTTERDLCQHLNFNPRTLQSHITNMFNKTGAENKVDLVLMALGKKQGSIDVEKQLNRWSKQRVI